MARRKAKIAAVPAGIDAHKSATLTEIETLRIRAAVARLRELDAVVAHLTLQWQQARAAMQQQNARCMSLRNEILTAYGFDAESKDLEVIDDGPQMVIRRKADKETT